MARHLKIYPKYVLYPCCTTACSNQRLRSINQISGNSDRGGPHPALRKPGGSFCPGARRAFGNYLAQRCQEIKQKTVQSKPARHDPLLCSGPTWPNVSPYPTVTAVHMHRDKKNPSPERGEHHQMLNRSLSPTISLATAAGSLQVSATNSESKPALREQAQSTCPHRGWPKAAWPGRQPDQFIFFGSN